MTTTNIVKIDMTNAGLMKNVDPDVFDYEIDPQQLDAFLGDPRHVLFVALDGDLVVGMASGFEYFHPDKKPQMFINEVGVASSHRRQGIGRSLVESLIAESRHRGCVYAWLGTEHDNHPAQACFSSVPDGEEAQSFLLYEWDFEDSPN